MSGDATGEKPARSCPICGKPAVERFHPFCSVRCANVDLNRWLTGSYVIAASVDAPGDDDVGLPSEGDEDGETN